MQVLKLDNVKKYYGVNTNITKAVDGVSFDINESEFVAIRSEERRVGKEC